jgi:hypothetical protein
MKNILSVIAYIVVLVVVLDLAVVSFGLAQIAFEGRTGYWSPFWLWQAKFIINLLQ